MKLDFDLENVRTTEFGVGNDDGGDQEFSVIQVDGGVQEVLHEMALATWNAMQDLNNDPPRYEPSEKHEGCEYVYLPIDDDLAKLMRDLHEANNLPLNTEALSDMSTVFCYFARMSDNQGRRLTMLRRANQFKGVLKSRLIRVVSDALAIIPDKVFKLDSDFDLLVDGMNVHILRPSSFVFAGKLQEVVRAAAPENIAAIQQHLAFVDFDGIREYASKQARAARYLASIRAQDGMSNIDRRALMRICRRTGVEVEERDGKITIDERHALGFLEVLDRRRYEIELVNGSPECYRAASRSRLQNNGVV